MVVFRISVRGLVPGLRMEVVSVLRVGDEDALRIILYVSPAKRLSHASVRLRLYVSSEKNYFMHHYSFLC